MPDRPTPADSFPGNTHRPPRRGKIRRDAVAAPRRGSYVPPRGFCSCHRVTAEKLVAPSQWGCFVAHRVMFSACCPPGLPTEGSPRRSLAPPCAQPRLTSIFVGELPAWPRAHFALPWRLRFELENRRVAPQWTRRWPVDGVRVREGVIAHRTFIALPRPPPPTPSRA